MATLLTPCEVASLTAAIHDTALWGPFTWLRPSCSTPNHQASWAEVVVRGHEMNSDGAASFPHLSVTNCFTVLSSNNPVHPVGATAASSLKSTCP